MPERLLRLEREQPQGQHRENPAADEVQQRPGEESNVDDRVGWPGPREQREQAEDRERDERLRVKEESRPELEHVVGHHPGGGDRGRQHDDGG